MSRTAEPYIKVTCSLPGKSEVQVVADELGINDDEALGLVVRFFIWLDSQMNEQGYVDHATPERISRQLHRPGLVEALVKAGWVMEDGAGIMIPNHNRHMGVAAKKRMYETERKRLQRKRDNVP